MNLFEIKSEYLAVLDLAENPETDPQTVADTLEAINADFEEKCDNCAFIIKQLKVDIAALKEEKKQRGLSMKLSMRIVQAMNC